MAGESYGGAFVVGNGKWMRFATIGPSWEIQQVMCGGRW